MRRRRSWALLALIALGASAALVIATSGRSVMMSDGTARGIDDVDSTTGPESANDGSPTGTDPATTLAARPRAKTPPPKEHDDRIKGRVVNADGKPIADALVLDVPVSVTEAFEFNDVGREGLAVSDAITDADGRFAVAARGDNPRHTIIARAPSGAIGYAIGVPVGGDEPGVTIVIDGGGTMRGTVTDRDGKPVGQSTVQIDGVIDALHLRYETKTNADGAYRIDGLPTAPRATVYAASAFRALVEVTAEGFAPLLQDAEPYATTDGAVVERDYVLSRGSNVEGTVIDAETNAPIVGARVVLWSNEGNDEDDVTFVFNGSLRGMPRHRVRLPRAPRVLSESVSEAGGRFRLERVPGIGFHAVLFPKTDERQSAVAPVLYVTAFATGFAHASASIALLVESGRQTVSLVLSPAASIEGRVVTPTGIDPSSVTIGSPAIPYLPSRLFPRPTTSRLAADHDGRYRIAAVPASRTADVVVRLSANAPGSPSSEAVDVSIGALVAGAEVIVRASRVSTAPDLVLAPPSLTERRASYATIRVVDFETRPIRGAQVGLEGWGRGPGATTDRDGIATLSIEGAKSPEPSPIVVIFREGYASRAISVAFASKRRPPVSVTLARGHSVSGRVLRADGQPARDAWIQIMNGRRPVTEEAHSRGPGMYSVAARGRSWWVDGGDLYSNGVDASTDVDGRFVVADLPAGPYHVGATVLEPFALGFGDGTVTVVSGVTADVKDLVIRLPPSKSPEPGRVRGLVRDATTGLPPRELRVELRLSGGQYLYARSTDARSFGSPAGSGKELPLVQPGRFEFGGLRPGTHRLHILAEGYAPRSLDVVVEAGGRSEVPPTELIRGVVVHGHAKRADGEAFERDAFVVAQPVSIRERHDDPTTRTAPIGNDGRFELSGLVPGRWRVFVETPMKARFGLVLVPSEGPVLVVPEGANEMTWERTLIQGGVLSIGSADPRLPVRSTVVTEEQRRFTLGCEVEVLDDRGQVVAEQKGGFLRSDSSSISPLLLPPGSYIVRTRVTGESAKEDRATVTTGKATEVTFGDKPAAAAGACGTGKCD